jgi:hypothetical protein
MYTHVLCIRGTTEVHRYYMNIVQRTRTTLDNMCNLGTIELPIKPYTYGIPLSSLWSILEYGLPM